LDSKNDRIRKSLKKFARGLLATTCLTIASSGAARAGTYTEAADFSNSSLTPFVLPSDTNIVTGTLFFSTDTADWVEFTNLLGGSLFTLNATTPTSFFFPTVNVLDDKQAQVAGPGAFSSGSDANLGPALVPADGNLIVGVSTAGTEGAAGYTITLNAQQSVPEPGTLGSVGLALAFLWRRKRNR
jgi:hypothetical protein